MNHLFLSDSDRTQLFSDLLDKAKDEKGEEILKYIEDFSKEIYQNEMEKENSILQQASNMQSAFSFVTAGLFVIADIVISNKGNTPYWIVILPFCVITALLLLSLLFATLAQERIKKDKSFPTIEVVANLAKEHYDKFKDTKSRTHLMIKEYNGFYTSLRQANEKRISRVKWSMGFFYASLAASAFSALGLIIADVLFN